MLSEALLVTDYANKRNVIGQAALVPLEHWTEGRAEAHVERGGLAFDS